MQSFRRELHRRIKSRATVALAKSMLANSTRLALACSAPEQGSGLYVVKFVIWRQAGSTAPHLESWVHRLVASREEQSDPVSCVS